MDREFQIAMEKAGVDPTEASEEFLDEEGIAYQVTVLYQGALEDEWLVETMQKGFDQAEALSEEYRGEEEWEFRVAEVYVGEDTIEASGYGVDAVFRPEPEVLPDPGDYVLGPFGRLGSRTALWEHEGKNLGTFDSEDDALEVVRDRMEAEKFYPNVWRQSDHGGLVLIELEEGRGGDGWTGSVRVSAAEVRDWKRTWPASGLPNAEIIFDFTDGELISISSDGNLEDAEGGGALSALADDALEGEVGTTF